MRCEDELGVGLIAVVATVAMLLFEADCELEEEEERAEWRGKAEEDEVAGADGFLWRSSVEDDDENGWASASIAWVF